jgi:hypothetical protein
LEYVVLGLVRRLLGFLKWARPAQGPGSGLQLISTSRIAPLFTGQRAPAAQAIDAMARWRSLSFLLYPFLLSSCSSREEQARSANVGNRIHSDHEDVYTLEIGFKKTTKSLVEEC